MNFHKRHYQQKTRSRPGQGNSVLRSFYENLLNESQKIERSLTKAYYVLFRKAPKEKSDGILSFFASSYHEVESELIKIRQDFSILVGTITEKLNQVRSLISDSKEEIFDLEDDTETILEGEEPEYIQGEVADCTEGIDESMEDYSDSSSDEQMVIKAHLATEKGIKRGAKSLSGLLKFRVFTALPIVRHQVPELKQTYLRFFTHRWSICVPVLAVLLALGSEVMIWYTNTSYLLYLPVWKALILAGVLVAISHVLAIIIFPQVKLLLGQTKRRLNAFWIMYLVGIFLMVVSFVFLTYQRLQINALTDEAVILSEQLNSLYLASDMDGGNVYKDLISQKDQELQQVLNRLAEPPGAVEVWSSRCVLILASLISLLTSSIMIGISKLAGQVSGAFSSIRRAQKKLDKLYGQHEERLNLLEKAQDLQCTLIYWILRVQVIEDLLHTPLKDEMMDGYSEASPAQEPIIVDPIQTQGSPFDTI